MAMRGCVRPLAVIAPWPGTTLRQLCSWQHTKAQYQDMDVPMASPTLVVARALGLSAQYSFNDADQQLLLEVLRATSYQAQSPILDQWLAAD